MGEKIDFASLKIEIESNDDEAILRLEGHIDENFLQEKVVITNKKRIILDLENVESFNSCGVRQWLNLIKKIDKNSELIFRRCSVSIIDQINMIPTSLGNAKIESFYAPYYCETHGEVSIFMEISQVTTTGGEGGIVLPTFYCDQCQAPLEFDALEDSYFLFLQKL